ncbi:hypothetical protein [Mycobacterium lehmannii]|uniref:hypothetical protein n=1 Tax=Mycobacterium lehmannii TaxID=2048550 RepID=UPI0013E031B4|nr:hypothetical protein [Mycobacterium lehmannii]
MGASTRLACVHIGGLSLANAEPTMLREIFDVHAITLIGNPSARRSPRISFQATPMGMHESCMMGNLSTCSVRVRLRSAIF